MVDYLLLMLTENACVATYTFLNALSPINQASAYKHSNYQTDSKAHIAPTKRKPTKRRANIAAENASQNSLLASGFSDVSRLAKSFGIVGIISHSQSLYLRCPRESYALRLAM
jgi:hypothetical protein